MPKKAELVMQQYMDQPHDHTDTHIRARVPSSACMCVTHRWGKHTCAALANMRRGPAPSYRHSDCQDSGFLCRNEALLPGTPLCRPQLPRLRNVAAIQLSPRLKPPNCFPGEADSVGSRGVLSEPQEPMREIKRGTRAQQPGPRNLPCPPARP
jgi:hypothetical protein